LVTDEAARAAAREILARDEFTRWHEDYEAWLRLLERMADLVPDWMIDVLAWLQRAAEAIAEGLARLLGFFGVFGDVGEGIGWIAVSLLAAAFVVLVWIWRERRQRQAQSTAPGRSPGRVHADALREARALAGQGRFLDAAHRVQLATLAMLIEFDWLELARSDPNRTLRDRVKASSLPERERRQLITLVDRLEALWFNEPADDRGLFEDWIRLDERLTAITTGGRA
jgi:hypothetical protein